MRTTLIGSIYDIKIICQLKISQLNNKQKNKDEKINHLLIRLVTKLLDYLLPTTNYRLLTSYCLLLTAYCFFSNETNFRFCVSRINTQPSFHTTYQNQHPPSIRLQCSTRQGIFYLLPARAMYF